MKKISKKADISYFMMSMVAVALLFAVAFIIWGGPVEFFQKTFGGITSEQKLEICKLKYNDNSDDYDGDKIPNSCDNCPFTPNFGPDVEDTDNDGFPIPVDPKNQVVWKPGDTEIRLCCGNYKGGKDNDPDLVKNWETGCETWENDQELGKSDKLISSYRKLKVS